MLVLQNIAYRFPDKELLFKQVNLHVNHGEKVSLIGNNGTGKSILFKIIAGLLEPSEGTIHTEASPYLIPQLYGQFDDLTMGQLMGIHDKLLALKDIIEGRVTGDNLDILEGDWGIEERASRAIEYWELKPWPWDQKIGSLSGGEKTKILLAGITLHQPPFILMDEPSNHLDIAARNLLYRFIQSTTATLMIISHDRSLLNLLDSTYELGQGYITLYGGNYDFYTAQKEKTQNALHQQISHQHKALRQAREKEKKTLERQQRSDMRGKAKQEKAGTARIMMNTLRNNAENSTSRAKSMHSEKIDGLTQTLSDLKARIPDIDKMKFNLGSSDLHDGKILVKATEINYLYPGHQSPLWEIPLSFQVNSGERIVIRGQNGSGKTTLVQLILGKLVPTTGEIYRTNLAIVYLDQEYSLIDNTCTIYQQCLLFNDTSLPEHEIKTRLHRFLFTQKDWDKSCGVLSGGEKMRLALCCLAIRSGSPDIIVLDEPTNNLDIQNIDILTQAISSYLGTLLVISHDNYFLQQIGIQRRIELEQI